MRAWVLQQLKSDLVVEDRPDLIPGPGEVVIDLKASALNRRDYWITQGKYPGIHLPVVLGSDGSGVVSGCGEGVDSTLSGFDVIIHPGSNWGTRQRVQDSAYTILGMPQDGTFASQVKVSASQIYGRPDHLTWEQAAALPLAGVTAYRAVCCQAQAELSDRVLITGIGGGVASFALQFAVAMGCQVWVTSSSAAKIEQAEQLGARGGFLYTEDNWPQQAAAAAEEFDVIIDGAAGPGYAALVNLAAPGARLVNYGATAGLPGKVDMFKVFWKQLRLQGTTMGSPEDFSAMLDLVCQQEIRPVIAHQFSLDNVNTALQQMSSSPQFGKYVLRTYD